MFKKYKPKSLISFSDNKSIVNKYNTLVSDWSLASVELRSFKLVFLEKNGLFFIETRSPSPDAKCFFLFEVAARTWHDEQFDNHTIVYDGDSKFHSVAEDEGNDDEDSDVESKFFFTPSNYGDYIKRLYKNDKVLLDKAVKICLQNMRKK